MLDRIHLVFLIYVIIYFNNCNAVSVNNQMKHIARRRLESIGVELNPENNEMPNRRSIQYHMSGTILGAPSVPAHLPEAESLLPGRTLVRPAFGMLLSAVKFPHKELEDGAGVMGNPENLGLRYDGRNERLMYSGFRRNMSPNSVEDHRKNFKNVHPNLRSTILRRHLNSNSPHRRMTKIEIEKALKKIKRSHGDVSDTEDKSFFNNLVDRYLGIVAPIISSLNKRKSSRFTSRRHKRNRETSSSTSADDDDRDDDDDDRDDTEESEEYTKDDYEHYVKKLGDAYKNLINTMSVALSGRRNPMANNNSLKLSDNLFQKNGFILTDGSDSNSNENDRFKLIEPGETTTMKKNIILEMPIIGDHFKFSQSAPDMNEILPKSELEKKNKGQQWFYFGDVLKRYEKVPLKAKRKPIDELYFIQLRK